MADVLLAASGAKVTVSEKAVSDGTLASAGNGVSIATGGRVGSVTVTASGVISVGSDAASVGTTVTIVLAPVFRDGKIFWSCSAGESTPPKFLPAECRN